MRPKLGLWVGLIILVSVAGVAYREWHIHHSVRVSTVRVMPHGTSLTKPIGTTHSEVAAMECKSNTSGKLLLVSISQQRFWACDGTQIVYQSAVTTGASALKNVDDATPVGTWHIFGKYTNTILRGCDANGCWKDPVAYWMPFDGSVGFHDASWQTFPFGSPQYQTDGSHGCVHLPIDAIKWVYGWAPVGTTVTVRA